MNMNFRVGAAIFGASLAFFLAYCAVTPSDVIYNDPRLEMRVNTLLLSLKENSSEAQIDLSALVSKALRKVCIQSPYDTPDRIEHIFEEKVPVSTLLMEDRYVWWFFYQDGTISRISVPVRRAMSFVPNSTVFCTHNGNQIMRIISLEKQRSTVYVYTF